MDSPVHQQGSSRRDGGDSDIITVYEFCAAEYGWTPDHIESRITDSQILAYLDKAIDRRDKQAVAEVDRMTLAVNSGTVITYDRDALRRWQSRHRRVPTQSEFSATVNRLASLFPGKVTTQ